MQYRILIILVLISFVSQMIVCTTALPEMDISASLSVTPSTINQMVAEIFKKKEITNRRSLSPDQSTAVYGKCATPIIRQAIAHPDWLTPENRFILFRPDDPQYIRYYYPDSSIQWTFDTIEGHFRIHYNESGTHAVPGSDDVEETIPTYVTSLGSYFEYTWAYEVNTMGYTPPPPDGKNGGNSRFDVYCMNMRYYGYTDISDGHPFIVVHNTYQGFESNLDTEGSTAGNMKITAAHEFFHAIQFFYDDWNEASIWWEENTAVWMEDEVFDGVNGYLNYLGSPFDDLNNNLKWDQGEPWYKIDGSYGGDYGRKGDVWFEAPHLSLETQYTSSFPRYEYGGVLWAKYLNARFGSDCIKQSFMVANQNVDALTALKQTLESYGETLEDTFSDFRVRVLTLDHDLFEEADKYPLVKHYANYGDYPISFTADDISHLACRYIGLSPPSGQKKLVIEMDGGDNSHFSVALVLFKNSGYEIRHILIDNPSTQEGGIEIPSFGTEGVYKRAALIPINISTTQDYMGISFFIRLEGVIQYTINMKEGLNLVSFPPCLVGVTTSYDFLRTYFVPDDTVHLTNYDANNALWLVSYLYNLGIYGSIFDFDWHRGYMLTVLRDITLQVVGDVPVSLPVNLSPGHNLVSTFTTTTDTLSSSALLRSFDKKKDEPKSIMKYDSKEGKWQTMYLFFNHPAGKEYTIRRGEGYIIDLEEGISGWSPHEP